MSTSVPSANQRETSAEEAERVRTPLFVPLPVLGLVWETDAEGGISGEDEVREEDRWGVQGRPGGGWG